VVSFEKFVTDEVFFFEMKDNADSIAIIHYVIVFHSKLTAASLYTERFFKCLEKFRNKYSMPKPGKNP